MKIKHLIPVLMILLIAFSLTGIELEKGTPELNRALRENVDPNMYLPVIVVMKEQYDSEALYDQVKNLNKIDRRQQTIAILQNFSERTQSEIRPFLIEMEKIGNAEDLRFLWITNVVTLRATRELLAVLDKRLDVKELDHDPLRKILNEEDLQIKHVEEDHSSRSDDGGSREIVYNVNIMNVPAVWAQGYYGEGVTVAILDTGVNYNHTDIMNRMWIHPDYPNYGYNFTANNHVTMDPHGHGTHCAGTVAGDGTSGSQTGVAPQASIMALRVLDSSGSGQQSYVWDAIQFSVTYGADVMSLSLGWLHAWSPNRPSWRNVMFNALSAGVVASVAAGNEGNQQYSYPIPDNVRTPGDCPPPWLHPDQTLTGGLSAVICLGATDSSDVIANFSGRGPVTWQGVSLYNDYPYNPGMGLIRPDVVAPGVNVKSLRHNNNTGYTLMSGTSMATPNAAGVMALLISKDFTLTPEDISQILEENALPLSTNKSNTYGSGRIDALASINVVTADNPPNPPINPIPADGATDVPLMPHLTWWNGGGASVYFLSLGTDNPPTNIVNNYLTVDRFYQVTEQLNYSTTYYWRVDAMNGNGQTTGNVWSFTTGLPVSEDFETGDFSSFNWLLSNSGTAQDWYVTSNQSFSGYYSARSGQVGDSSLTTLFITLEVLEPGIISFYRKISTEENYDFLRFFINTTIVGQWSGESDWTLETYSITSPGTYTFRWLYMKDPGYASGQDAVWIDDITFPPITPRLVVPVDLAYEMELGAVHLTWDQDDYDESLLELLGYNVYKSVGQPADYSLANTSLLVDCEFDVPITDAGDHSYYVTAVYDLGESNPSQALNILINPSPDAPVIDPPAGEYPDPIEVQIESDDPEVMIFYTIDDTEPSCEGQAYSGPILIDRSLTLKVKLYKLGHQPGEVIVNDYQITSSVDEDLLLNVFDMKIYPNPFVINNPGMRSDQTLKIDFSVKKNTEKIQIEIYNIKGQLLRVFNPQLSGQQRYTLTWDMKESSGKQVGSGIYLLRLKSGDELINRRVMVVK